MKKPELFKTNQDYLAEFFNLAGAQKRSSWEPPEPPAPAAKKTPPKPVKVIPKEAVIKNFQLKVKRSLRAGIELPLEALAKKHKLSFPEKCILAYFAGTELYRARPELSGMIGRFENKVIARAFETAKLLGPDSALIKRKLIIINPQSRGLYGDELALPHKVFTLITGVHMHNDTSIKRQPKVKGVGSPSKIYEALIII